MERFPESKILPGKLPAVQVSNAFMAMGREGSQVQKLQTGLAREVVGRFNSPGSHVLEFPVPSRPWKGKDSLPVHEELMFDFVASKYGIIKFKELVRHL